MIRVVAAFAVVAIAAAALALSEQRAPRGRHRVIFDTDFALPPQDDGLALALALTSPELEIVGITTVAGNYNVQRANADVLRMLEIAGRTDIAVYAGAARPLVHKKDAYSTTHYGKWWSDEPAPPPPGGFAKKSLEREPAADFIAKTIAANPGTIELLAIGPLTNVALAIRRQPSIVDAVKRVVVMGGAVPSLPDGGGNITPAAEFNFWVDPEAAREVLRSGMPIELSPLNVSRKTSFTKRWFDALVAHDAPLARLIKSQMAEQFERPDFSVHMYDELAVASAIDPTLVKTEKLVVDVDTSPGISYGASIGGAEPWPGAEGARTIDVQYDVDFPRFIQMFVDRIGRTQP
jgi:inosine-uridine nucleoside N-ribohydrolase